MENEFLKLVSSPLMNLDHTYRYSGTKLVEPESLSQHIIDTIMMGLKIIDSINSKTIEQVDPSSYAMKAIYHDLEEVITGDIPRPLKYYNDETLKSLRGVADEVAKKFFSSQFYDHDSVHYDLWSEAKEGREGYILKIVDVLVVASKVVKEVDLLNNYYMLRVAHEVERYLGEIDQNLKNDISRLFYLDPEKVYSILDGIVLDAITAMKDILYEHKDLMKSLDIYSQSMV